MLTTLTRNDVQIDDDDGDDSMKKIGPKLEQVKRAAESSKSFALSCRVPPRRLGVVKSTASAADIPIHWGGGSRRRGEGEGGGGGGGGSVQ